MFISTDAFSSWMAVLGKPPPRAEPALEVVGSNTGIVCGALLYLP